jgi:hypothetical protein
MPENKPRIACCARVGAEEIAEEPRDRYPGVKMMQGSAMAAQDGRKVHERWSARMRRCVWCDAIRRSRPGCRPEPPVWLVPVPRPDRRGKTELCKAAGFMFDSEDH